MTTESRTATGSVVVHVFGRTDVGRTREHNEDAFVVADLSRDNATLQPEVRTHVAGAKGSLFMVADGLGGAAAGEIASAMATELVLEELRAHWVALDRSAPEAFATALRDAVKVTNAQINQYAMEHAELRGMGSTATIAGLLGDTVYLAQVGDSRAYLIRGGRAVQITKDQSLMQKLVEAGELTEEEAERSDRRNIILQALGPEASVKVDLTHQKIRRGDALLLCSDGLSTQVSRDELAAVVSSESELTNVCKRLIDRANENGGPDNITVIVARFDGDGLGEADPSDAMGHAVFPVNEPIDTPLPFDRAATLREPIPAIDDHPPAARPTRRITGDSPEGNSAPTLVPTPRGSSRMFGYGLLVIILLGAAWYLWSSFGVHAPPSGG